jgi:hypothetical protein
MGSEQNVVIFSFIIEIIQHRQISTPGKRKAPGKRKTPGKRRAPEALTVKSRILMKRLMKRLMKLSLLIEPSAII